MANVTKLILFISVESIVLIITFQFCKDTCFF